MPNNNPQGHNQYSKRRDPMQQAPAAQSVSSEMTTGADNIEPTAEASADATDTSMNSGVSQGPAKRGFAAMDEATQRTIASKGGQSQGKENNPGNFANDRDRAREAGRKGGEAHGHRQP